MDADTAKPIPSLKKRRFRIPAFNPYIVATVLLAVSFIAAPFSYHSQDVFDFFLAWGRASEGWYPWRIYDAWPPCNYPPFCLYLLTIMERTRLLLNAPTTSILTICLLKIPFFLAHVAGVLVCYLGLRRPFGGKDARRIALLYALCFPLFVNGAQWAQADALLMLAVVAAVIALTNEKPVLAGVLMGWALSIKFQAIIIGPMLLVYALRRFGVKQTLLSCLALAGTLLAFSLPFLVAGKAKPLLAAYTEAAGFYPVRSLNAMNLWGAANVIDTTYRGLTGDQVNRDDVLVIGRLTYHHISLLMTGSYYIALLIMLWRQPTRDRFLFACGLGALGFFVLTTQMHERYIVPAAALLTLPALFTRPRLLLYAGVCLTASVNQLLILFSNYLPFTHRPADFVNFLWGKGFFPCSLLNCLLLVFGTVLYLLPSSPPTVSHQPPVMLKKSPQKKQNSGTARAKGSRRGSAPRKNR
ncbi:MAG: glycosyltransferase 87 family protein [Armatimonadota bacterium]